MTPKGERRKTASFSCLKNEKNILKIGSFLRSVQGGPVIKNQMHIFVASLSKGHIHIRSFSLTVKPLVYHRRHHEISAHGQIAKLWVKTLQPLQTRLHDTHLYTTSDFIGEFPHRDSPRDWLDFSLDLVRRWCALPPLPLSLCVCARVRWWREKRPGAEDEGGSVTERRESGENGGERGKQVATLSLSLSLSFFLSLFSPTPKGR